MPLLTLASDEARRIVCEDHGDWDLVPGTEKITGNSRWSIEKVGVFKHGLTGKHYRFDWSVGATEMQDDQRPFEYQKEVVVTEVSLQEVTRQEWLPVKDEQ
jgi:hypothetical protein